MIIALLDDDYALLEKVHVVSDEDAHAVLDIAEELSVLCDECKSEEYFPEIGDVIWFRNLLPLVRQGIQRGTVNHYKRSCIRI